MSEGERETREASEGNGGTKRKRAVECLRQHRDMKDAQKERRSPTRITAVLF